MNHNPRSVMCVIWMLNSFCLGNDIAAHRPHDFFFWLGAFSAVGGTFILAGWVRQRA